MHFYQINHKEGYQSAYQITILVLKGAVNSAGRTEIWGGGKLFPLKFCSRLGYLVVYLGWIM